MNQTDHMCQVDEINESFLEFSSETVANCSSCDTGNMNLKNTSQVPHSQCLPHTGLYSVLSIFDIDMGFAGVFFSRVRH